MNKKIALTGATGMSIIHILGIQKEKTIIQSNKNKKIKYIVKGYQHPSWVQVLEQAQKIKYPVLGKNNWRMRLFNKTLNQSRLRVCQAFIRYREFNKCQARNTILAG